MFYKRVVGALVSREFWAGLLIFASGFGFGTLIGAPMVKVYTLPPAEASTAEPASQEASVALEGKSLPIEGLTMRYYVPHEPRQDEILARHSWSVYDLIAHDLALDRALILRANGLNADQNQAVSPGTYLRLPIALGHTWSACATYYGDKDHGKVQADGTRFDKNGFSVAIKELPKPFDPANRRPRARVTIKFVETGIVIRNVAVRDSGPYYATCDNYPGLPRAIDLSEALMKAGGVPLSQGTTQVEITLESLPPSYIWR